MRRYDCIASVEAEILAGTDIAEAVEECISLAQNLGVDVRFTFADWSTTVNQFSRPLDIVQQYEEACQRPQPSVTQAESRDEEFREAVYEALQRLARQVENLSGRGESLAGDIGKDIRRVRAAIDYKEP